MSEVESARKYIKERYGFIFKKTGPKVRDERVVIADGFTPIPTVEMALYAALEDEVIKRLSAPVVAPIVMGSADQQAASDEPKYSLTVQALRMHNEVFRGGGMSRDTFDGVYLDGIGEYEKMVAKKEGIVLDK